MELSVRASNISEKIVNNPKHRYELWVDCYEPLPASIREGCAVVLIGAGTCAEGHIGMIEAHDEDDYVSYASIVTPDPRVLQLQHTEVTMRVGRDRDAQESGE